MSQSHRVQHLTVSIALFAATFGPGVAHADVGVGSSGCVPLTIQAAIDVAASGETIWIPVNGTYEENLVITKKVYLRGAEANGQCNMAVTTGAKAVLKPDPLNPSYILNIDVPDSVSLFDLHLREGGKPGSLGGAIHAHQASVTLYDTVLAANEAGLGGGVYLEQADLGLVRSEIRNNTANAGGAIYAYGSTVFVGSDSVIGSQPNTAVISGGSIHALDSQITIEGVVRNSTASDGSLLGSGGCIFARTSDGPRASVTLQGAGVVRDCQSLAGGGAIELDNADLSVSDSSAVVNGDATDVSSQGGLVRASGDSTIALDGDAVLADGRAQLAGGAIWMGDTAHLSAYGSAVVKVGQTGGNGGLLWQGSNTSAEFGENAQWTDGVAGQDGGLIYLDGGVLDAMDAVLLTEGQAIDGAGIFAANGATVTLRDTMRIYGNLATGNGGGVYLQNATFNHYSSYPIQAFSQIGDANFPNRALNGAGIFADNSVLWMDGGSRWRIDPNGTPDPLDGVRVDGNIATVAGGGLALYGSSLYAEALVVANNHAQGAAQLDEGDGGGMAIYTGSDVVLGMSTFYKNRARERGGGVYVAGGSLSLSTDAIVNETDCEGTEGVDDRYCSEFHGNVAARASDPTDGIGGALYIEPSGVVDLQNTALWGNGANGSAPQIYLDGGQLELGNVLIASASDGHTATDGVRVVNTGRLQGTHVTMGGRGTTLDYVGGSQTGFLNHSVIWPDGQAGAGLLLAPGAVVSGSCNVGTNVGALLGGVNENNTDPQFIYLPGFGYYHIDTGSPAFEQCATSPKNDDLDLHPRPMGEMFDAGAFEVQDI